MCVCVANAHVRSVVYEVQFDTAMNSVLITAFQGDVWFAQVNCDPK